MIECIKITSVIKAVWEFKYLINWSNQDYRAYLGSSSHMCRAKMRSIKNACSMLHVVWSTHVMKPKSFPSFVLLAVMRGPKKKNQCLIRSTFLWVLGVQTQRVICWHAACGGRGMLTHHLYACAWKGQKQWENKQTGWKVRLTLKRERLAATLSLARSSSFSSSATGRDKGGERERGRRRRK